MDDSPSDCSVGFQIEIPSDDQDLRWDWRSTVAGMIRKDLDAQGIKVRDVSFDVLQRAGPYPRKAMVHIDLEAVATKEVRAVVWATIPKKASEVVFTRVRLAHLAAYEDFLKLQKELEEATSSASTALAAASKMGEGVKSTGEILDAVSKIAEASGKVALFLRAVGVL